MKHYLSFLTLMFCGFIYSQSNITGKVIDEFGQEVPGANIVIVNESVGTTTDMDGKFELKTQKKPPFQIQVSMLGYATQTVNITSPNQKVNVTLKEDSVQLGEIVVSASRTPERILESPVTIERMGLKEIKNTTSPTFYEGLENLKEVHFNTSSFNFKSINTRGFATIANTRFMQLVDGMDNSSPALNFVLGNLIGLSDLDVHSVELLPGASSALYGANAFNGILFMNSKNPFDYEGISSYVKRGITTQELAGTNEYFDMGIRAAKKFTPHFAAKANFNYMRATEWIAGDQRSMTAGGDNHMVNQNYDGLNIYGDEVSTFIPNVGQVSRTGYREQDLNDNRISNVKADFSLHFRPFATSNNNYWESLEVTGQYKVGAGNTVYQGANRYALRNFIMEQYRAEITHKNFFVRGYVSTEDAGDSYDMRFAAWNINRQAKSDQGWFTDYATAFLQSQIALGFDANQAAVFARNFATHNINNTPLPLTPNGQAQFQPGTTEFANALATVRQSADLREGALFKDNSQIWHADWNYNFSDLTDFADIQIGGSLRRYVLNSQGTIFTDFDGPIRYGEYGLYTQLQKKFGAEERLKFTGSVRYDKNEFFDGQFSPRVSFVYSAGERKNHNFRASFQTGFRNPTTQDLFIGLNLGPFALIGSAPTNLDRYVDVLPVSASGQAFTGGNPTVTLTGVDAYNNSYTIPSVQAFAATGDASLLEIANISTVKPEQVKAFELGYKSIINGFNIDLNGYYNIYNDFMSTARVITPYYGQVGTPQSFAALANGDRRVYQIYTNTSAEITSWGIGAGVSRKVYKDFELGVNYNMARFNFDQDQDPTFIAGFNTPEHRAKFSFGNDNVFKNFGFNVNGRWWSEYEWQSSFADGTIPSTFVLDAQISYQLPKFFNSVLKLSASNIGNNDYLQVIGAGMIGQIYTASITLNP